MPRTSAYFIYTNLLMDSDDYYRIGKITRPHGLKGEITALLEPDLPNDFTKVDHVFVLIDNNLVPFFIQSVSFKGNKAYIRFEDIEDVDAAAGISGRELFLSKSFRPAAKKGEFYDDELVGFKAEDKRFGQLGIIGEVIRSGLQRLLSVDRQGKQLLIPVNGPFITRVDRKARKVIIELPDGYLDI